MPRSIEMLTYPAHITFMRRGWGKDIGMRVSVTDIGNGKQHEHYFPESDRTLSVDGLDHQATYQVKIKSKTIFSRLTHRSRVFSEIKLDHTPRILVIGSGRCGTTSITNYLNGLTFIDGKSVYTRHETLFEYILEAIINGDEQKVIEYFNGFWHDIESAPHLTPFAGKLAARKILHMIRDGRRVIQSGLNRGWYQKDDIWERIKPSFDGNTFQKCCRFWAHMVTLAEKHATKTVRLEDVAASHQALGNLIQYLEIKPTSKKFPVSNTGKISSDFRNWSKEHRDQFEEICGPIMDKYYAGWQKNY